MLRNLPITRGLCLRLQVIHGAALKSVPRFDSECRSIPCCSTASDTSPRSPLSQAAAALAIGTSNQPRSAAKTPLSVAKWRLAVRLPSTPHLPILEPLARGIAREGQIELHTPNGKEGRARKENREYASTIHAIPSLTTEYCPC